eukprot:8130134-Lingulodinium_polyedra.AAC.1
MAMSCRARSTSNSWKSRVARFIKRGVLLVTASTAMVAQAWALPVHQCTKSWKVVCRSMFGG